jgi:hypothetical protein
MVKGLKPTSSPIQISAIITETAANTFTTETIDLTLNVLDNEVFVVTQLNIDVDAPDMAAAGTTNSVNASISTTSRTTVGSIADSNVLGAANRVLLVGAAPGEPCTSFDREDPLFAAISEDYLGIIATNNAFLNIQGILNGNAKTVRCRVYGFRATASSSTYAALVQSELLSA